MPETTIYTSVDEIKKRLHNQATPAALAPEDTILPLMIAGACRVIDHDRGTRFHTTDSDETKYFTAIDGFLVRLPNMVSITTVSVDKNINRTYTEWTQNTEYEHDPFDGATPIRAIRIKPGAPYVFPRHRYAIKVEGKFGYCSSDPITNIPAAISEAAALLTMRLYVRKDTILGTAGSIDVGIRQAANSMINDTDIRALLDAIPKRLYVGAL